MINSKKSVLNKIDAYLAKQTVADLKDMLDFPWPDKMHIDVFVGTCLQLVREVCKRSGHPVVLWGTSYMIYDGEKYLPVSSKELSRHFIGAIVKQAAMSADAHMNNYKLYDIADKKADLYFTVQDVFGEGTKPVNGIPFRNGLLTAVSDPTAPSGARVKFIEGRDPRWLNTYLLDAEWGTTPKATPVWDKFSGFSLPDAGLRQYTMGWIGNAIAGDPLRAEKAMLFVGIGGAGKSTILQLARDIVSTQACMEVPSLGKLTENEGRYAANMESASLCMSSDSSSNVRAKDLLKSLVSKEPFTLEEKFKNPREIMPRATIMCASNDSAIAYLMNDSGLNRRFDMIKFDRKPKKPEPGLSKMLASESQDIAHKMALEWVKHTEANGILKRPDKMQQYIDQEAGDNNPVASSLMEAGLSISQDGGDVWIQDKELYAFVHEYHLNNGYNVQRFNLGALTARLKEFGAPHARGSKGKPKFYLRILDKKAFASSQIKIVKSKP